MQLSKTLFILALSAKAEIIDYSGSNRVDMPVPEQTNIANMDAETIIQQIQKNPEYKKILDRLISNSAFYRALFEEQREAKEELEDQLEQQGNDNEELNRDNEELNSYIQGLRASINERDEQLNAFSKEREDLKAEIITLSNDKEALSRLTIDPIEDNLSDIETARGTHEIKGNRLLEANLERMSDFFNDVKAIVADTVLEDALSEVVDGIDEIKTSIQNQAGAANKANDKDSQSSDLAEVVKTASLSIAVDANASDGEGRAFNACKTSSLANKVIVGYNDATDSSNYAARAIANLNNTSNLKDLAGYASDAGATFLSVGVEPGISDYVRGLLDIRDEFINRPGESAHRMILGAYTVVEYSIRMSGSNIEVKAKAAQALNEARQTYNATIPSWSDPNQSPYQYAAWLMADAAYQAKDIHLNTKPGAAGLVHTIDGAQVIYDHTESSGDRWKMPEALLLTTEVINALRSPITTRADFRDLLYKLYTYFKNLTDQVLQPQINTLTQALEKAVLASYARTFS